MKKYQILFFLLILIFSCQEKKDIQETNYDRDFLNSLIEKGINNGDTISYDRAFNYVLEKGGYVEFYYYALLMANKYNYDKAYYNLYILLTREGITYNGIEIFSNDEETQRLANYYLLKAYELGHKGAHSNLEEIFGDNIPKSNDYVCKKDR